MQEPLSSNRHPLNQRAKALLRQVKADADPQALYVSQLMKWSLDKGNDRLKPKFRDQIASVVDVLQGQEPEVAMRWLLDGQSPGEQRLHQSALQNLRPVTAAQVLLESVHSKLVATIPGYHPPSG